MGDASIAVLYKEWTATPVFHPVRRPIEDRQFELDDGWLYIEKSIRTECGRVVEQWGWEEHTDRSLPHDQRIRNHRPGTGWPITLRRDHAEAFARLCQRCARAEDVGTRHGGSTL